MPGHDKLLQPLRVNGCAKKGGRKVPVKQVGGVKVHNEKQLNSLFGRVDGGNPLVSISKYPHGKRRTMSEADPETEEIVKLKTYVFDFMRYNYDIVLVGTPVKKHAKGGMSCGMSSKSTKRGGMKHATMKKLHPRKVHRMKRRVATMKKLHPRKVHRMKRRVATMKNKTGMTGYQPKGLLSNLRKSLGL